MARYQWSALNKQQVGAFAEYFVKMELTMYGFEVYSTEVDDRGIDSVARRNAGPFIEVQVKSLRDYGYVFMRKDKFELRPNVYLALAMMFDGQPPRLYFVPATTWLTPNEVFVDRCYEVPAEQTGVGMQTLPQKHVGVGAVRVRHELGAHRPLCRPCEWLKHFA